MKWIGKNSAVLRANVSNSQQGETFSQLRESSSRVRLMMIHVLLLRGACFSVAKMCFHSDRPQGIPHCFLVNIGSADFSRLCGWNFSTPRGEPWNTNASSFRKSWNKIRKFTETKALLVGERAIRVRRSRLGELSSLQRDVPRSCSKFFDPSLLKLFSFNWNACNFFPHLWKNISVGLLRQINLNAFARFEEFQSGSATRALSWVPSS